MNPKPSPFNIIRYPGEPQAAEFEGVKISRETSLFIQEWGAFVTCTPYDDHFIFEIPPSRKRAGLSDYMCTCGSAAVVARPETETTRLFVCLFHATYGGHQTSIVNKKDFDKLPDEVITPRGRKWPI